MNTPGPNSNEASANGASANETSANEKSTNETSSARETTYAPPPADDKSLFDSDTCPPTPRRWQIKIQSLSEKEAWFELFLADDDRPADRLLSADAAWEQDDMDPSVANALRRCMMMHVPSVAIEELVFDTNVSLMSTKEIADAVSLLPLDSRMHAKFVTTDECDCEMGCDRCCAKLKLRESYERKALADPPYGQVFSGSVHSLDSRTRVLHQRAPLFNLGPGHVVSFTAIARKASGAKHVRWQPISECTFRPAVHIALNPAAKARASQQLLRELVKTCPDRIFRLRPRSTSTSASASTSTSGSSSMSLVPNTSSPNPNPTSTEKDTSDLVDIEVVAEQVSKCRLCKNCLVLQQHHQQQEQHRQQPTRPPVAITLNTTATPSSTSLVSQSISIGSSAACDESTSKSVSVLITPSTPVRPKPAVSILPHTTASSSTVPATTPTTIHTKTVASVPESASTSVTTNASQPVTTKTLPRVSASAPTKVAESKSTNVCISAMDVSTKLDKSPPSMSRSAIQAPLVSLTIQPNRYRFYVESQGGMPVKDIVHIALEQMIARLAVIRASMLEELHQRQVQVVPPTTSLPNSIVVPNVNRDTVSMSYSM